MEVGEMEFDEPAATLPNNDEEENKGDTTSLEGETNLAANGLDMLMLASASKKRPEHIPDKAFFKTLIYCFMNFPTPLKQAEIGCHVCSRVFLSYQAR